MIRMLVLSIFPGIDLLGMAFEEQGFCVVRGPDLLWGGDIKKFYPPAGRFDGVIGGPPCQAFSSMSHIVKARYGEQAVKENLIPEFERCVLEASPNWFLMENVRHAPIPSIEGYSVKAFLLNARSVGSKQNRVRRFSFGVRGDKPINLLKSIEIVALEHPVFEYAVLAGKSRGGTGMMFDRGGIRRKQGMIERRDRQNKRTVSEAAVLQGLPPDFLADAPFTVGGKYRVIGNGVPLPMGRAIAKTIHMVIG